MLENELEERNTELKQGQKKVNTLKNTIDETWETLENDFHINKIMKMENELTEKQLEITELKKKSYMHTKII